MQGVSQSSSVSYQLHYFVLMINTMYTDILTANKPSLAYLSSCSRSLGKRHNSPCYNVWNVLSQQFLNLVFYKIRFFVCLKVILHQCCNIYYVLQSGIIQISKLFISEISLTFILKNIYHTHLGDI